MQSVFRIVCLIIGVLAFVFALNESVNFLFDVGGNLRNLIILAATSTVAFIALILLYSAETYPARRRQELLEEELERETKRQLGTR